MNTRTFKRLQVLRTTEDLYDTNSQLILPRNARIVVVNPKVLSNDTIKVRDESGTYFHVHLSNVYESSIGRPSKLVSKAFRNAIPVTLDIDIN